MKKVVLLLIAAFVAPYAVAQEKVEAEIQADIVSQYIWRGLDLGDAAVQPTLGVSWRGLSLTAWGSVGITNWSDTKEFDLTLGYSFGKFNVGITDYWFNVPNPKYFVYAAHETSHIFEANVGYDLKLLSLQWYTYFAGNDGVNNSGKRAYSSYFEAAAPFRLGGLDWTATLGIVPWATTLYEDSKGFVVSNVSLRAEYGIKITDSFSIPIFASINTNPNTGKAAFVVGLTLKP